MNSIKNDEGKEECNYAFSDVETISFADWYRDQSKDDDMMNELGDDKEEVEEVKEENDGPENRKTNKKKLGKQVIIYELNCPQTDCTLSFNSLEQLYQHQETVHGIMAYNCLASGCSEQFNKLIGIKRHYSTAHSGHTNWICTHCSAKLNDSNQLRRHIREMHQYGRFGCASVDCSFEADLRSKVRSHCHVAHPRLVCSFNGCGKGFYYESQLKLHSHFCHSDTAKLNESIIQNQVGMIGKNDRTESNEPDASIKVDSNEAINSKVIILGVKCAQSDCDMMLGTMSELHQHHKFVHGVLRYPCLIAGCSEQFNHGIKIGHHHSTVHPHPHSWVCSKCDDFKFANPHVLRCHIRDFHQYGHFQCGYSDCAFEANLRSTVRNHCARAHARFSCPIGGCDYVAHYEYWVKAHQQTVHHATTVREERSSGNDSKKPPKDESHSKVSKRPKMSDDDVDDETTNKKKPIILGLKCPQSECNLMFESFSQLHQHQKYAHRLLAFPCLVTGCEEQYNNRHKIGDHYSTVHPHHTNWACPQCNAKKANSTLLRRHIRDYHQFGQFHCGHLVCTFEADLRSKVRKHTRNVH